MCFLNTFFFISFEKCMIVFCFLFVSGIFLFVCISIHSFVLISFTFYLLSLPAQLMYLFSFLLYLLKAWLILLIACFIWSIIILLWYNFEAKTKLNVSCFCCRCYKYFEQLICSLENTLSHFDSFLNLSTFQKYFKFFYLAVSVFLRSPKILELLTEYITVFCCL